MKSQTMMGVVGVELVHTKSPQMEPGVSSILPTNVSPFPKVGVAPDPLVVAVIQVSVTAINQLIQVNQVGVARPAVIRQEVRRVGVATAPDVGVAVIRLEMRRMGVAVMREVVLGQEVGVVAMLVIKMEMVTKKGVATTIKVGVAQEMKIAIARQKKNQRVGVAAASQGPMIKKNPRTLAVNHVIRVESHVTKVPVAVVVLL